MLPTPPPPAAGTAAVVRSGRLRMHGDTRKPTSLSQLAYQYISTQIFKFSKRQTIKGFPVKTGAQSLCFSSTSASSPILAFSIQIRPDTIRFLRCSPRQVPTCRRIPRDTSTTFCGTHSLHQEVHSAYVRTRLYELLRSCEATAWAGIALNARRSAEADTEHIRLPPTAPRAEPAHIAASSRQPAATASPL